MVMKTAEAAPVPSEVADVGEDSNDAAVKMQETVNVNTRKRILEKATYDDLEAPDAKKSAPLTLSKMERYFTGPTPGTVRTRDLIPFRKISKTKVSETLKKCIVNAYLYSGPHFICSRIYKRTFLSLPN